MSRRKPQTARIRALAEQVDARRKRQQAAHPGLTLTGMYNVLEKLRSGEALTVKERAIHEQGLVSVLRQLHDDLDAAVFEAYGWSDLSCQGSGCQGSAKTNQSEPRTLNSDPAATILTRLVALNAERAAEEARGQVRWLRPEFQCRGASAVQSEMAVSGEEVAAVAAKPPAWRSSRLCEVQL